MEIVPFEEADLDEIMEIENVSFAAPWSRQCYLDLAPLDTISFFVVKDEGKVLGYMLYQSSGEEMELHTIAVSPGHRREGIAKKMIEHMISDGKGRGILRFFLQVRPSNDSARALYKKYGFTTIGIRKNYYRDNFEDALVMKLELK